MKVKYVLNNAMIGGPRFRALPQEYIISKNRIDPYHTEVIFELVNQKQLDNINRMLYGYSEKGRYEILENTNELHFNIIDIPIATKGAYSISKYLNSSYKAQESTCIAKSSEAIMKEFGEEGKNDKGGIITFSTDVNAKELSSNKLINWLKQKFTTILNRLQSTKEIDKIASSHNLQGWTVGHYLSGRYTAQDGKTYGENSLSVEVVGVDSEELEKIAEELCIAFLQESVLVKDYNTNKIFLVAAE